MKPPKPADWDTFVTWFRANCIFAPRNWAYEKAPEWLWKKYYGQWKATGRCPHAMK